MKKENFQKLCDIETLKIYFISSELLLCAWEAAVQQRGAKKKLWKKTAKKKDKYRVRNKIFNYLRKLMALYSSKVSEDDHIDNINNLCKFIERIDGIDEVVEEGSLIYNFSTSQKLLNTTLKYWWCMGWISEPPHFPMDSINLKEIYNCNEKNTNWTAMDEGDYKEAIGNFKNKIKEKEYFSLATWELENWHRRSDDCNDGEES